MAHDSKYVEGIGRRKTAVARVRLFPKREGAPGFTVNECPLEEYFPLETVRTMLLAPLTVTGTKETFTVFAHVRGGGAHAQAEAVRLGIARALVKMDEAVRSPLRAAALLTRDPREKERKKPGLKRARRAPQWQKR